MILRQIAAVVRYNLREIVKDRFFYGLFVFALLLLGLGMALGTATFGAESKIVLDAGLAGAELLGVFLAVILIIGSMSREMERRTIYVAVTKPMPRWAFVVGKYAAAVLAASALSCVTAIITVGVNVLVENTFRWGVLKAVPFICFQIGLVASAALFFTMVSTPILSGLLTVFLYVIGHTIGEVRQIAESLPSRDLWMKTVVDAAYRVFPDLEKLNARSDVISHLGLMGPRETAFAFLYSLAYASIFVWLASLVFSKKDLK
ncbi:MAG: hypothetical protein HYT87_02925 [Nitrospirae bacterium]|nr:hypothetical protein [Nitrospirota bacterium]